MKDFSSVLEMCKNKENKKIPVVICAEEKEVLKSIIKSLHEEIIKNPILIGDEIKIKNMLLEERESLDRYKIINILDKAEASEKAVNCILNETGDFLIKGLVDTSIVLKAILNEKETLSRGKDIFFSHVALVKVDKMKKLILISDAAMNIAPGVREKIKIVENAVIVAKALEIENPKIALIAAKEKVSPKMQATLDAAEVVNHYKNKHIIIEGPLALDNAVSESSAEVKSIQGKIKGDADILIMPNIEAGNILYKALTYFSNSQIGGLLIGAKVPIVITSRADNEESKFLSIALATLI